MRSRVLLFACLKDTVAVAAPHGSRVSIVGAQPLAIDRVPHVHHLAEGQTNKSGNRISVKLTGVELGDGQRSETSSVNSPCLWPQRRAGLLLCCTWFEWWTSRGLAAGWVSVNKSWNCVWSSSAWVGNWGEDRPDDGTFIHLPITFLQIQIVECSGWLFTSRPRLLGWAQPLAIETSFQLNPCPRAQGRGSGIKSLVIELHWVAIIWTLTTERGSTSGQGARQWSHLTPGEEPHDSREDGKAREETKFTPST